MSELEIGGLRLDSTFWDVALLVVAFLFFVLLSYVVHFILDRIADSLKRKQRAEVIEHLISATYRPITLFFLVQGLLAVVVLLGTMERWQDAIGLDEWLTVIYRVWGCPDAAVDSIRRRSGLGCRSELVRRASCRR